MIIVCNFLKSCWFSFRLYRYNCEQLLSNFTSGFTVKYDEKMLLFCKEAVLQQRVTVTYFSVDDFLF